MYDLLNSHAALPLGVGPSKFGLIQAVHTLGAVHLYETAFAALAAPGAGSHAPKSPHDLPLSKLVAPPPS